jgi:hypothetical protein
VRRGPLPFQVAPLAFIHTRSGPTRSERRAADMQAAIQQVMLTIAGDLVTLLEVVAGGPELWRNRFHAGMRPWPVNDYIADHCFRFFCQRLTAQFPGCTAGELLDALDVPTPPTQREIDAAWQIDSASSEDGRKFFYGDLHPQEWLDREVGETETVH